MIAKHFPNYKITAATILAITVMATFVVPQHVQAQSSIIGAIQCINAGSLGFEVGKKVLSTATAVPVSNFTIEMRTTMTSDATLGNCFYDTVLVPLARLLARMVLQQITAATISWINGSNGSGQVLYVQNFGGLLQGVGDYQTSIFLGQLSKLNSPFGATIASALRANYLQQTSAAGFFAANKSTLLQSAPNIQAFLNGDWTQGGGVRAWFALTTQSQNNPYTLYQASQAQLAKLVETAQSATSIQLEWGRGFLSWCGTTPVSSTVDDDGNAAASSPAPNCTKSDGSPGTVETPGSVLHDYTQKAVVASGIEQLINANDLDSALGAIIAALGKQILGAGGGLFGASQSTGVDRSFTSELRGYTGETTSSTGSPIGDDLSSRMSQYEVALGAATTATNLAQSTVSTISCAQAATSIPEFTAQIQIAFATIAQGKVILTNAQTVRSNASFDSTSTLANVPPTSQDIATVQQLTGQMNTIVSTVHALEASCNVQAP
jgi:hypothetical protein